MDPEKISLKSILDGMLAFQDDLARLYEQAAKEGSDRTHFQSFRQLSSLNAQHATELREILESQSQSFDLQPDQLPEGWQPPAREQAGDDEQSLTAKALLTEKALLAACTSLLKTAQLPPSIRQLLERQAQASQQAQSLLQAFL